MALPTPTEFKLRFTEFTAVADERIQLFLDDSALVVSVNWGELRNSGINYLTAHHLYISEQASMGDSKTAHLPIASEGVETVNTSYGALTTSEKNNNFVGTSYGQYYLYLLSLVAVGGARIV